MSIRSGSSGNAHTVFVGGIPGNVAVEEVRQYFARFGRVVEVVIPPKKSNPAVNNGYCFVAFDSAAASSQVVAIGDHYLGSRRVSCKPYLKGSSLSCELQAANEKKLFVKFVPGWVSEAQFREYFAQFGQLASYYMVKYKDPVDPKNNSSVGYLVYTDPAVGESLATRRFFKIGNKKMQVEKFDKNLSSKDTDSQPSTAPPGKIPQPSVEEVHSVKPTAAAYRRTAQTGEEVSLALGYRFNVQSSQIRPRAEKGVGSTASLSTPPSLSAESPRQAPLRSCLPLLGAR